MEFLQVFKAMCDSAKLCSDSWPLRITNSTSLSNRFDFCLVFVCLKFVKKKFSFSYVYLVKI